jgi:hypothetical protein
VNACVEKSGIMCASSTISMSKRCACMHKALISVIGVNAMACGCGGT